MNRKRNNYFNLVSSEEEEKALQTINHTEDNQRSNSRTQNSFSTITHQNNLTANTNGSKERNQQFSYNDVSNFKSLQNTASLHSYGIILKKFIEYEKNVLFVFGPSGCGKTLLIETLLKQSSIKYEWARARSRQNEDTQQTVYQDIFDVFYREIKSKSLLSQKVILFNDFPIVSDESPPYYVKKYKQFRDNVYQFIKKIQNRKKYVFILNSQIYSSYHILSESSETKALQYLDNVLVLKAQAYGKKEMKAIVQHFLKSYPTYYSVMSQPKDFQDIILQAQGDARKALHQIYYKKLTDFSRNINKQPRQNTNRNNLGLLGNGMSQMRREESRLYQYEEEVIERKTSICHMLGKFLYGKRFNIYYNPNIKIKKDNEISAYYSERELARIDPKFYFRPVAMLQRSRLATNKFGELIEENFIYRFGKVKDIANMYDIFRFQDAYLQDSTNRYQLMKDMEQIMKQLLTWGILIYNRNSVRASALFKIQRSKNTLNSTTINKKLNLIKSYYLKAGNPGFFWHYRLKDVLMFAFFTKPQRPSPYYSVMHQKLVEVIFDTNRAAKASEAIQIETNVMQDQQEQEIIQEGFDGINQIQRKIKTQIAKKQRQIKIVCEDSEEEDIDFD